MNIGEFVLNLLEKDFKMSKKRFVKLLMGYGYSRNEAKQRAEEWRAIGKPYSENPTVLRCMWRNWIALQKG